MFLMCSAVAAAAAVKETVDVPKLPFLLLKERIREGTLKFEYSNSF